MINRTLLYGLPLSGVDSPDVEALRSYMQRLAYLHSLGPFALLDLIRAKFPFESFYGRRMGTSPGREIHGISRRSHDILERLGYATGIDLSSASMFRFASVLSSLHLLHQKPGRYCPICVRTSTQPEEIPGKLAWEIQCVECCAEHKVLLAMPLQCGTPSSQQIRLARRARLPGVCSQCGSIGHLCSASTVSEATEAKIWMARSIGRILALSSNLFSSASLRNGLDELLKARFRGSAVSASVSCGFSRSTVRAWSSGKSQPPLSMLAILCYRAEADVAAVLEGRYDYLPAPAEFIKIKVRKYELARTERAIVARTLDRAAKQKNPPSLGSLAKELGANVRVVREFAPVEVERFSSARRAHLEEARLRRLERFERTLIDTAKAIVSQDKPVTCKRLLTQCGVQVFKNSWRREVVDKVVVRYRSKK